MGMADEEIESLRAAQLELMTKVATVSRGVKSSDGAGGFTETFTSVATDVPCRVTATSSVEVATDEHEVVYANRTIVFPSGTDVRVGDRVTVGTRVFRVLSIALSDVETARRVLCSEK